MNTIYKKIFKTDDESYVKCKQNKNTIVFNENTDDEFIMTPIENLGEFNIISLHRSDIDSIGYDSNCIDDNKMYNMALNIAEHIIKDYYWKYLEIYCEANNFPKIEY